MSQPTTIPYAELSWKLIIAFAALGLLWPLSKAIGLTDGWAPAVIGGVWVAIRIAWIAIVVVTRTAQPFWTLFFAGLVYGGASVIPQQIFWSEAQATRIPAFIGTLVMGAITGALCGLIAQAITPKKTGK